MLTCTWGKLSANCNMGSHILHSHSGIQSTQVCSIPFSVFSWKYGKHLSPATCPEGQTLQKWCILNYLPTLSFKSGLFRKAVSGAGAAMLSPFLLPTQTLSWARYSDFSHTRWCPTAGFSGGSSQTNKSLICCGSQPGLLCFHLPLIMLLLAFGAGIWERFPCMVSLTGSFPLPDLILISLAIFPLSSRRASPPVLFLAWTTN